MWICPQIQLFKQSSPTLKNRVQLNSPRALIWWECYWSQLLALALNLWGRVKEKWGVLWVTYHRYRHTGERNRGSRHPWDIGVVRARTGDWDGGWESVVVRGDPCKHPEGQEWRKERALIPIPPPTPIPTSSTLLYVPRIFLLNQLVFLFYSDLILPMLCWW